MMATKTRAEQDWARCRDYICAALAHGDGAYQIEDVEEGVRKGDFHFWPGERSAAITQVLHFPRKQHFLIFLAGGELGELKAMLPSMASLAKFLGCEKMRIVGRAGWARALKECGWERDGGVSLSCPVE